MRTYYIAYDDSGIYGIKFSPRGALRNAKEEGINVKTLQTAPATLALAKHVLQHGGDVGFSVERDGCAYLIKDHELY